MWNIPCIARPRSICYSNFVFHSHLHWSKWKITRATRDRLRIHAVSDWWSTIGVFGGCNLFIKITSFKRKLRTHPAICNSCKCTVCRVIYVWLDEFSAWGWSNNVIEITKFIQHIFRTIQGVIAFISCVMDKQSLGSMNDVSVWSLNAARLEWDFTQTGILISPHILQCKRSKTLSVRSICHCEPPITALSQMSLRKRPSPLPPPQCQSMEAIERIALAYK